MEITRWSILKSDYVLCSQRWRSSIQSVKTRPGADCSSDHELLIAKFRLKLKKVAETSRPFSSVQFSHSVKFNSLQPQGLQHARPPSLSPTPRAYSNPCPSHPLSSPSPPTAIFPIFQITQFFTSGGQSIGISASASASVLPMNIQD